MVERIINEIKKDLKHGQYLSAISLSMTLIDRCSKTISYENEPQSKYFPRWYDKYVDFSFDLSDDNFSISYGSLEGRNIKFDGVVCYGLRCSLIHSGETTIGDKLDPRISFNLTVEGKSESKISIDIDNDVIPDENGQLVVQEYGRTVKIEVNVNVIEFCNKVIEAVEKYQQKCNKISLNGRCKIDNLFDEYEKD